MTKLDKDNIYFTQPTGDPFADAGGYVIKYLYSQSHLKEKSILELIEYATKIYVNNWNGKLNAFFLNSTITQPAFKGDRKLSETLKYYKSLIEGTGNGTEGYCRISGRKTRVFSAGRDNHILSGSGTFINFHHSFDSGLFLSKEALIRMFFVPLGLIQLSDKIALLNSSHNKLSEFFVFQNCENNFRSLATGISEGVFKSQYNDPANAIFQFVDDCLTELSPILYDKEDDVLKKNSPSLTLYHFTNFGASPEIAIYKLTSDAFRFYAFCNRLKFKTQWTKFVRFHYRNSKFKSATFIEDMEIWQGKERVGFEVYKKWRNTIFEKLLTNESILPNIVRWARQHSFPFTIVEIYQKQMRNMEKRTIEKIKHLAEFITNNKDADYIKRNVTRLNREKYAHGLRQFMLRLNEQNYHNDAAEPLINLKDYTEYLFPDGSNWREIRDILLIAIYENLHAQQVKLEMELTEEETEATNEN